MTNEELANKLDEIKTDISNLKKELVADINNNTKKVDISDTKIDASQKSTNQVVNLAFGLIVTATISITTAALAILIPMATAYLSNK